jgi:hypothetical protein
MLAFPEPVFACRHPQGSEANDKGNRSARKQWSANFSTMSLFIIHNAAPGRAGVPMIHGLHGQRHARAGATQPAGDRPILANWLKSEQNAHKAGVYSTSENLKLWISPVTSWSRCMTTETSRYTARASRAIPSLC